MAQKQKAVVLFSGGVDSTTCLALAIERFGKDNVVPLSIQYGQKHSKELEAAIAILEHYGMEGKTMDVTKLFAFSNCSLLVQSSEDIPQGSYKEQQDAKGEGTVSTYVPFRNGLFLSSCSYPWIRAKRRKKYSIISVYIRACRCSYSLPMLK